MVQGTMSSRSEGRRLGVAIALLCALAVWTDVSPAAPVLSLSATVSNPHATLTTRICGARHVTAIVRAGRPFRVTGQLTTTTRVTLYPLHAILVICPGSGVADARSVPIRPSDGTFRAAFTPPRRGDYRLTLGFHADATHAAGAIVYVRAR